MMQTTAPIMKKKQLVNKRRIYRTNNNNTKTIEKTQSIPKVQIKPKHTKPIIMLMVALHTAALSNHKGAALLAAGDYANAFDAFLFASETIRNIILSPEYQTFSQQEVRDTRRTLLRRSCFTEKQYLHGVRLSPDLGTHIQPNETNYQHWIRSSYSLISYASTNSSCHYGNIYEQALVFHVSCFNEAKQTIWEQPCQLFLAATTFNIALTMHLQSLHEGNLQHISRLVTQYMYDTTINILLGINNANDMVQQPHQQQQQQWDPLDIVEDNVEASCILAVALNNKCTLCYSLQEFQLCESLRYPLVLLLNTLGKNELANFLDEIDILAFYQNGFLLMPPVTSPAA